MQAPESIDGLLQRSIQWLSVRDSGPQIVVSTRLRLARNLQGFPFPSRADANQRLAVLAAVRKAIKGLPEMSGCLAAEMVSLSDLDRQFLVERSLISREQAAATEPGHGVFIDPYETCSIMVNEEDHLRLQVMRPGLQLREAWQTIDRLDSALSDQVEFAYTRELGFLTSCPTNVGTGVRASVMLHLPALALAGCQQQVMQAVLRLGFAVRGLHGEGSDSVGNLFQISNQSTLGASEARIIDGLEKIIARVVEHERNMRQLLLERDEAVIYDYVGRAYGTLLYAHILESKEALNQLSALRLGVDLGVLTSLDIRAINRLLVSIQPAHLQKASHSVLQEASRDVTRAQLIRSQLVHANGRE